MRVLGVDPGSATTGFGIVERQTSALLFVVAGTIRTRVEQPMPHRLLTIHRGLLKVIDEHAPDAMSLERNFVARNVQSAFRIGEARAAAMLAAARRELAVHEYPPNEVKLAVAAFGHADKAQVKYMVRRTLKLDPGSELADDAADALALAICHLFRGRTPRLVDAIERPAAGARMKRR
jgi:crossover junction endodeoxyribonuclease RuvC